LSENYWNSGKKKHFDSAIKSCFLESVIESIIERKETFEYNSDRLSRSEQLYTYLKQNVINCSLDLVKGDSALTLNVDE